MYPGGMRIGLEEEQAVLDVLRSKRLFRYYGPVEGPSRSRNWKLNFLKQWDLNTRSRSALAPRLMCGLAALGVGPGDEVIIPAYTWIATAETVMAAGAVPVLAEIDRSLMIDPDDIERKILPIRRQLSRFTSRSTV